MSKKKENNKKNENKSRANQVVESFNNADRKQKEVFVNALEKALNFNPKKK